MNNLMESILARSVDFGGPLVETPDLSLFCSESWTFFNEQSKVFLGSESMVSFRWMVHFLKNSSCRLRPGQRWLGGENVNGKIIGWNVRLDLIFRTVSGLDKLFESFVELRNMRYPLSCRLESMGNVSNALPHRDGIQSSMEAILACRLGSIGTGLGGNFVWSQAMTSSHSPSPCTPNTPLTILKVSGCCCATNISSSVSAVWLP